MGRHGEITAQIGELLSRNLRGRGYTVHYDHGVSGEDVGTIVSWFEGEAGYRRESELSQLDIAVVDAHTKTIALLLDLEEQGDRSKTFLGDLFGSLLGDGIWFAGSPAPAVDQHTTLFVVGVSRSGHNPRNEYIEEKVNAARRSLGTRNAKIGRALIWTFTSKEELEERLPAEVERLIQSREAELMQA